MEKRRTVDAHLKTFLYFDDADSLVVEFAKMWLKAKKGRAAFPDTVSIVTNKPGFVGSGRWMYKYKDTEFEVNGYANGKGFWGTDYYIRRHTA